MKTYYDHKSVEMSLLLLMPYLFLHLCPFPLPPRLVLPEYILDFGYVISSKVLSHTVNVTNNASVPVSFHANRKPLTGTGNTIHYWGSCNVSALYLCFLLNAISHSTVPWHLSKTELYKQLASVIKMCTYSTSSGKSNLQIVLLDFKKTLYFFRFLLLLIAWDLGG